MRYLLIVLFALTLAACAPRSRPASTVLDTPQALQTEQTAQIAFHRMEIGFLQTGEYTTNALLDLELPQGVKWTLQDFGSGDYRLSFSSDEVPGFAWTVSPQGVRSVRLN